MFKLRDYQEEAVEAGVKFFTENLKGGALEVLPTGSGKSIVIASIAYRLPGATLVLQPSKEILEQNYAKMVYYMGEANIGVYSASAGRKDLGKITFATIGSIINKKELFAHFEHIIVDEAHLVNSKGGMYENLIKTLGRPVLGLTATPYRLQSYSDIVTGDRSVVAKFLHRTRPRIFEKIIHVTQLSELYEKGFLAKINYTKPDNGYDFRKIKLNSTGMDFDEESLLKYNIEMGVGETVEAVIKSARYKHILVFTSSVMEAKGIAAALSDLGVASVSAETPKKEREEILEKFKSGEIKVVTNVGVLTTGFDFPALDCIILARPTQSVALYYQMCGRGLRPYPEKMCCYIIDICGNVDRFGRIETFEIVEPKPKLHRLKSDSSFLTGFDFISQTDLEAKNYEGKRESSGFKREMIKFTFGKYKDQRIFDVPHEYLLWLFKTFDPGYVRDAVEKELKRRGILPL